MSSSSTLVRSARSIARQQPGALLVIPMLEFQFPVRIAVSPAGRFVLGDEVPVEVLGEHRIRVDLGDGCGGGLAAEGWLDPSCPAEDRSVFEAVHPGCRPVARLRPDVVAWGRGDELHAFSPSEWMLEEDWVVSEADPIVQHLNDCHGDVLAALGGSAGRAVRAVSLDPDGLLLDCGSELQHVLFAGVARAPADSLDEIATLLRALPEFRGRLRMGLD